MLADLSKRELEALEYDWDFWARRNQLAPGGDWTFWLVLAGRGFGKTRTGAEWTIQRAWDHPGEHIAIIGPTARDTRSVMLSADVSDSDGASGILAISPPWFRPEYEPSNRLLKWPNGTRGTLYSAEEPDRLRGPQHHSGWVDEIAAWAGEQQAWDQFKMGLRLGKHPQVCLTTTPRPIKLITDLLKDPACVVTRGRTYDNLANLSPVFIDTIIKPYEGTRLGRQELEGEVLTDVEGALWTRKRLDDNRVRKAPDMQRIVIGVDPAGTHRPTSDETGIIVAGTGVDSHGYTIADLSCQMSPASWGRRVVNAFWMANADCVAAEGNYGGEMVAEVIRAIDPRVPVKIVHASKGGKYVRAEPVAAMDEQGKDHHVGMFEKLEDQMCNFSPKNFSGSPDRMDAKVWAYTEMFFGDRPGVRMHYYDPGQISKY